jgi:hypothetical protein
MMEVVSSMSDFTSTAKSDFSPTTGVAKGQAIFVCSRSLCTMATIAWYIESTTGKERSTASWAVVLDAEQAPSVPYTALTVVPPQIETAMENISHLVGCPRKTICTHRLVYGVVILFLTVSFAHRTQFGITMSVPQKAKNIPCFWVDI